MYSVSNSVQSYLNLKTTNADLMQRIADLEENVQVYKKKLEHFTDQMQPDLTTLGINQNHYHYIPAKVIHNEIFGPNNYILLNKGSKDGISEDMGVVSVKGIVGVVSNVSDNFSRVIPVLNSGYHPICMLKNTRYIGPLFWDGKDPRFINLSQLPSYASYSVGDTIVTSEYSAIYPEGVLVGIVEDALIQNNEDYNSVKVRLFTDFSTLNEVFIIWNPLQQELKQIEKGAIDE